MELKTNIYTQEKRNRIFFLALQCDSTVLSMSMFHARFNSTPSLDDPYVMHRVSFTHFITMYNIHLVVAEYSGIFLLRLRNALLKQNVMICDIYANLGQ